MANKFTIEIHALDKATRVFRKVNNQMSLMARPAENVRRQIGALGRELHIDKITRGMGKLSQASLAVGRSLGIAAGPLESLLGLGAAGGIAAVAGAVAALGARWGRMGYEINRTSQSIAVSTDDLQKYRGAAGLAGVSSDVLTQSLGTLGTTLQDALYGRNPQALVILNKLGIGIKRNADGVVDSVAAFKDLSLAISRIADPRVQQLVASAFGLEGALPLLRQGPEKIAELAAQAQKFGLVAGGPALDGAQKFGDSMNRLKGALEGVANAWGDKLTPALTRGADSLTKSLQGGLGSAFWDIFVTGKATRDLVFGGAAKGQQRASGVVTDAAPNSFRDPRYDAIDKGVESRLGLPPGLLSGIRLNGERSNADQVSSAGARSVYQIIPSTRDSALKKYGIDAYAGPDQAAEVAGRLLKEGMDRNNGDSRAAVREYIGGTNPRNWGATTEAYTNRVAGGDAAKQAPVEVKVSFANAPPGTTASAKSGNAFLPTRISYSMPTTVTP